MTPHSFYVRVIKRAGDLLVATLAMTLCLPALIVISLFLFWTNGGKVIFRQQRVGRGEVPFTLCKFRTLGEDAQTPLLGGKWLRRTSLDELPQLWNVIRGEMSLIGPRPLYHQYLAHYSSYHRRRHDVKPGITGLAQVSGRNALSWSERFDYDLQYVEKLSFVLDFRIMIQTARVLFQTRKADFHDQNLKPFQGYDKES